MSAEMQVRIDPQDRAERNAKPPHSSLWTLFEEALKRAHPVGALHAVARRTGIDPETTARQLVRSGRAIGAKVPPPIEDFARKAGAARPLKPSHSQKNQRS